MILNLSELASFAETVKELTSKKEHKVFTTKVNGITFDNRQDFIRLIKENTEIKLVRDSENKHDPNAVGVKAQVCDIWVNVGFIPKELSFEVASLMDVGNVPKVGIDKLWKLSPEEGGKDIHGLTLKVEF